MEVLLLVIGVYYTLRSRNFPLCRLGAATRSVFCKHENGRGEITVFSSLCTNLAATLGTGNIIGVAAAIMVGGAGALFWMVVAGIVGMATKCAENILAVRYRCIRDDGTQFGGPFAYLSNGAGGRFRYLAPIFCAGCALSGILGMGTVTQSNSIALSVCELMPGKEWLCKIVVSCAVTILTGAVILGGGKRIARFSECLIPAMSLCYILICLVILIRFRTEIPSAVRSVFAEAFRFQSVGGAATGICMAKVMEIGIRRGVFTNEAGLGTSAITAAAAEGSALEHGYAGIVSVFVDTVLLCSLTGLCVLVTNATRYTATPVAAAAAVMNGLPLTPRVCSWIFSALITVFAFSTILGWNFYAARCASWLFQNDMATKIYQYFYLAAVFLGPHLSAEFAWRAADLLNWLMAIPNLTALWVLRREVLEEMK